MPSRCIMSHSGLKTRRARKNLNGLWMSYDRKIVHSMPVPYSTLSTPLRPSTSSVNSSLSFRQVSKQLSYVRVRSLERSSGRRWRISDVKMKISYCASVSHRTSPLSFASPSLLKIFFSLPLDLGHPPGHLLVV